MGGFISPFWFLGVLALGAIGVALALPRKGLTPQLLGGLIGGVAGGLLMFALGLAAGARNLPNVYFYIFSVIALGAALRVITHPRPVYSALYFILTVIASAGLFLILSAEFMAFALIIVYAGAILITYLFVIMLAAQAPEEGREEVLAEYDTNSREPVAATVVAFVLVGVLTTMAFRGLGKLETPTSRDPQELLLEQPRKVERVLRAAGVLKAGQSVQQVVPGAGGGSGITVQVLEGEGDETKNISIEVPTEQYPKELHVTNGELLGFNLLRGHPGSIEIAGVILLMAMLGAVVLSRKQVQLDEDAKARQATMLARPSSSPDSVSESPLELVDPIGIGADAGVKGPRL